MKLIQDTIKTMLEHIGISGVIELSIPPKPEMGDLAFGCFQLAKEQNKKPNEVAEALKSEIRNLSAGKAGQKSEIVERVEAFGPYVNFFLNPNALAKLFFEQFEKQGDAYGSHTDGKGKKVLVEFAHPNTHKAFHIGHLRNIITGESIVRMLRNAGYNAAPVNYQGDIGLHIAKCLYGVQSSKFTVQSYEAKTPREKAAFLGEAYARGSQAFESDTAAKDAIVSLNEKIYTKDPKIMAVYQTTRQWSLEYFDAIYARVGTHFDRLYFESEVAERGKKIVLSHTKKQWFKKPIFKKSDGAIIFEGSAVGLHDRVFINSKGFPTYEGKEMGLAELQYKEFYPDQIIHITGREQSDYFRVVFAAIACVFPKLAGKEVHIPYGWVTLKSGKMSSRTGQVVLGEWLLDEVEKKIGQIMSESDVPDKDRVVRAVSLGAVKYSMLATGVANDIVFDIDASISTSGSSGPYLQYIVARINGILMKSDLEHRAWSMEHNIEHKISGYEKQLLLSLLSYPDVTMRAAEMYDPSQIAQYLFDLAQRFNRFYEHCPVLDASPDDQSFRLQLLGGVAHVMAHGPGLLGIETVEKM